MVLIKIRLKKSWKDAKSADILYKWKQFLANFDHIKKRCFSAVWSRLSHYINGSYKLYTVISIPLSYLSSTFQKALSRKL